MFVIFSETNVQRAGLLKLNINSGFVFKCSRKGGVKITTRTCELEKIISAICFNLWGQDSTRCPRCFFAELAPFNHRHIPQAAQCELARDRQSDNAATDYYGISRRLCWKWFTQRHRSS